MNSLLHSNFRIARLLLPALLVDGIVVGGVRFFGSKTTTPTYQTTSVRKGSVRSQVTAAGTVTTANNVQVTTQTSGVVRKILVKNGENVRVGQTLVELELDQEGIQRYKTALANYIGSQQAVQAATASQYSLQSAMFAANQKFINGAVAANRDPGTPEYIQQQSDWLAAEANYKKQALTISQAQNTLDAARISLREASAQIQAPLTGTLSGLSLQVGSVVTAQTTSSGSTSSQKIANIVTKAVPTVTIPVTQVDITKLEIGKKAVLTFDAFPDNMHSGTVVSIDTVGSVSSGVTTYPTVIALEKEVEGILPNMTAQVTITTATASDVLVIPASAVQSDRGKKTVQRMRADGSKETVQIEVGILGQALAEIRSGLSEGDIIVTGSSSTTKDSGTSPFSPFGGMRSNSQSGIRIPRN